jgi:hypothetical protein
VWFLAAVVLPCLHRTVPVWNYPQRLVYREGVPVLLSSLVKPIESLHSMRNLFNCIYAFFNLAACINLTIGGAAITELLYLQTGEFRTT